MMTETLEGAQQGLNQDIGHSPVTIIGNQRPTQIITPIGREVETRMMHIDQDRLQWVQVPDGGEIMMIEVIIVTMTIGEVEVVIIQVHVAEITMKRVTMTIVIMMTGGEMAAVKAGVEIIMTIEADVTVHLKGQALKGQGHRVLADVKDNIVKFDSELTKLLYRCSFKYSMKPFDL